MLMIVIHLYFRTGGFAVAIFANFASNRPLSSSHPRRRATATKLSLLAFVEEGCGIDVLRLDFFDKAHLVQEMRSTNTATANFW